MKRYFYLISVILIVVAAAAVFTQENTAMKTDQFDNGEISFNYPANWQSVAVKYSQVASFTDPESGLNVTVSKQATPAGYTPKDNFTLNFTGDDNSSFKLVSSKNINVSGMNAYENVYKVSLNGSSFEDEEIWVENNGVLYSIICTAPVKSGFFGDESSLKSSKSTASIDLIKKSFSVNASNVKNSSSPFWGKISIPSIGAEWGIRSDTVNAYNSTYHLPESYYPGENGACGILGHHTIFSAPFSRIDELKTGDTVIITDFLSQKVYTYTVTSNGDIKWDYKTNPIQFNGGTQELILVTCWPPGRQEGAFMIHCKLSSVQLI